VTLGSVEIPAPATKASPQARRIVIAGAAGWANLGDDVIAATIATSLRPRPDHDRLAIFGGPLISSVFPNHRTYQLGRHGILNSTAQALELIRATHLVIGGGGLLNDLIPNAYRPFVRAVGLAALSPWNQGTYLVGIGGREPTTDRMRKEMRRLGRRTRFAWWRDESTRAALASSFEHNLSRVDIVAPDPVFVLPSLSVVPTKSPFIVVNLRPWWHLVGRVEVNPGKMERLIDVTAVVLKSVAKRHGCRVVLESYCASGLDSDLPILARLREKLGAIEVDLVEPRTAGEASAAVAGAQACLSMRLHPIVVATTQGVPSVALSYDPKVAGACQLTGQPHRCLPLGVDPERLEWALTDAMAGDARVAITTRAALLRDQVREAFEGLCAVMFDSWTSGA